MLYFMVGDRYQIKNFGKKCLILDKGQIAFKKFGGKIIHSLNQSGSLKPGVSNHNLFISFPSSTINP